MNKPYDYKLSSVFGGYMPYVVYMPHDTFKKYPFHIRVKDFNCLSPDGCGCAYGKTPWGPWVKVKLFKYVIVGKSIVRDTDKLEELNAELQRYYDDE